MTKTELALGRAGKPESSSQCVNTVREEVKYRMRGPDLGRNPRKHYIIKGPEEEEGPEQRLKRRHR